MRLLRLARHLAVAASFLVGVTTAAHAADDVGTLTPGKIVAGVDANNKPYSYIDNGKMTGFDVELVRAIAAKLGLTADFRAQDFAGLLPSVANQQVDLSRKAI